MTIWVITKWEINQFRNNVLSESTSPHATLITIQSPPLVFLAPKSKQKYFLRNGLLVFSKSWHAARNLHETVHDQAESFYENLLPKQFEKSAKNGPTIRFFEVTKNFLMDFGCFIMKNCALFDMILQKCHIFERFYS